MFFDFKCLVFIFSVIHFPDILHFSILSAVYCIPIICNTYSELLWYNWLLMCTCALLFCFTLSFTHFVPTSHHSFTSHFILVCLHSFISLFDLNFVSKSLLTSIPFYFIHLKLLLLSGVVSNPSSPHFTVRHLNPSFLSISSLRRGLKVVNR